MTDEIRGFSPANARRIVRQVRRVEGWSDPPSNLTSGGGLVFPPAGLWIKNDSGEAVPPHGVMAVTDSEFVSELDDVVLTINKPSTTFRRLYLPNGREEIPDGEHWKIILSPRPRFAYDSSWGTPAAGEAGGPKPGSWLLWKNYPAICDVRGIRDATNKILLGTLEPINHAIGKTTGAVTGGTSSTTSYRFYTTAGGVFSGADAGFTTVPAAYSMVDLDSGIWIKITPMGTVCLLEPLECNA